MQNESKANLTTEPVTFERIVTIHPAFDRRHSDPKKNYGIHGCELRMILKGPEGATQFLLFTNWQLPHVTEETLARCVMGEDRIGLKVSFLPNPADKGYHWSKPQYEGQSAMKCDLLPGGECYYDGSGLNAEDTFQTLLKEGSEGVWRELAEFYQELRSRRND